MCVDAVSTLLLPLLALLTLSAADGEDQASTTTSHYIVDGCTGSTCSLADNGKPIECAFDDSTKGSTMGDTDSDYIAVQCCAMDGSSAARPGCIEGVSFAEAEEHCASEGFRLCTMAEVLTDMGQGKGCLFSDDHVWTSTPCSMPDTPTSLQISLLYEDASCDNNYNLGMFAYPIDCAEAAHANPQCSGSNRIIFDDYYSANHESWGCRCCRDNVYQAHGVWEMYEYTDSHYIVDGCTGSTCNLADNGKPIECASDDSTKGSTMGDTDTDNIAVQCCAMDGSSAARPGCVHGVTFADAEDHCGSNNLRLCTMAEVLTDMGKGKGCLFSDDHVWTSTPCSTSTNTEDASAPLFVNPESPATNKNVWVIDLTLPSANVWAPSLFVLLLVLAVCVAFQKCHSTKRIAYAKVQMDEIVTDEDQAINA